MRTPDAPPAALSSTGTSHKVAQTQKPAWGGGGRLLLGCGAFLTGFVLMAILVFGWLLWALLTMEFSIDVPDGYEEQFGWALQAHMYRPILADADAAEPRLRTPAPPSIAGDALQAATLGPAVAAAWNAGDRKALLRLVDTASLLRGLLDPEVVTLLEREPPSSDLLEVFEIATAPATAQADSETPVPDRSLPPGTRILYWPASYFRSDPFLGWFPPGTTLAAEGVRVRDGVPAAVLSVTSPGTGPAPCDGVSEVGPPVVRELLLVPTPEGLVGAVYFVGKRGDWGTELFSVGDEYLASAYRRCLLIEIDEFREPLRELERAAAESEPNLATDGDPDPSPR